MNLSPSSSLRPQSRWFQTFARSVVFLLWISLIPNTALRGNPSGGVVVHGDVRFSGGDRVLSVHQNSRNAIIDWSRFSIDAGETTRFVQPDRNSAVLNRVTGGDPSEIHGNLQGNGAIFVINPNGILVGPGGRIDAHSVVLSTLDVENGEFLSRGDLVFKGATEAGVTNLGRVQGIGGDVFLIGRTVTNRGSITGSGTVGLAAGSEVLLTAKEGPSGERLFVRASGAGVSGDGIYNDGTIEGAAVELKSHGNVYALAINNKGSIRATGATVRGGRVKLHAEGGRVSNSGSIRATVTNPAHSAGVVIAAAYARVEGQIRAESGGGRGGNIRVTASEVAEVTGHLDASGSTAEGGSITVEGDSVNIGSSARLDGSGASGGQLRIGGGFRGDDPGVRNAASTRVANGALLIADAKGDGDAGEVVVWADQETDFRGQVSAEARGGGFGGRVEVSGKERLVFDGVVSTLALADQRHGLLLLDPTDFEIVSGTAGTNQITATALVSLLGGGNVIISTLDAGVDPGELGDITVAAGANVVWNNANSLTLLAHHDVRIGGNLRNSGTGGIHLIAGWDGITGLPQMTGAHRAAGVLRADSFPEESFGNGGGSVYIGDGLQSQRISVGSRGGETQVAAYDLVVRSRDADVNAAQRNAQLGFFDGTNPGAPSGAVHSGSIGVRARNDIRVLGGTNARAWAQIGHGGNVEGAVGTSSYTGDISLRAGRDVLVESAEAANTGVRSYAQIGHGGAGNGGVMSGNLLVDAGREVRLSSALGNNAYSQIGHGGFESTGSISGSIVVRAGQRIQLTGGESGNSYAQIGHGGATSTASIIGSVILEVGAGGLVANAGKGSGAYVQIGHGGNQSDGPSLAGDLRILSEGDIAFGRTSGNVDNAYAMIGHGGTGAQGLKSGLIEVESTQGSLLFGTNLDGTGRSAVQVGHGGRGGNGNTSGSIRVNAPFGDIRFHGVLANGDALHREGYAQIGHGGRQNPGNHGASADEIRVTTGGDLEFLAGGSTVTNEAFQGREAYAQIGNGGYQSNGNHASDITVNVSGDILFDTRGDSGDRAYVQIGHGGYFSSGRFSGDINVNQATEGGSITFLAGRSASYALLGHGGRNDHDSTRDSSGADGINNSSDDVRVPINPSYSPGTIRGDIAVSAGGDIVFTGGFGAGATSFAQIGHGGYQQDAEAGEGHEGNIRVVSSGGKIAFTAGTRNSEHAMIGHGGHESFGNHHGNITVEAYGGISLLADGSTVTVNGGDVRSFAQIGHGGTDSDFATNRVIANVGVVNGAAGFHPLIPRTEPGTVSGDIFIRTTGENSGLFLRASQGGTNLGLRGYAQVGHGGLLHEGVLSGNLSVETRGGVTLVGGTVRDSHAQIGHGGGLGTANLLGDLRLSIGGDLTLQGGSLATSNALIGHGGLTSAGLRGGGSRGGAFRVEVGGITRLVDGGASAYLGHLSTTGLVGGSRYSLLSGQLDLAASRSGVADLIRNALDGGDVEIGVTSGDLVVSGTPFLGNSPHGIELLASGSVRLLTGLQNAGTGSIAIAAGWDGTTGKTLSGPDVVSFDAIQNERPAWGRDGGEVWIGDGSQGVAATVGTRLGATRVFGDAVVLQGGLLNGSSARIGYLGGGGAPIHGLIDLRAGAGGLSLLGGRGTFTSAQVGHGGLSADEIGSGILLDLEAGSSLVLAGGAGAGSHAQLGHGGVFHEGDISGELLISSSLSGIRIEGGAGQNSFAQIGHGGLHGSGSRAGEVALSADSITVKGGSGAASFARVGHGGMGGEGSLDGDITVRTLAGDLELSAGTGNASFVQIGHGGIGSRGSVADSNIGVSVDDGIVARGGSGLQASVQIGHGGASASSPFLRGTVSVTATGDSVYSSGTGGAAFVQVGHGGSSTDADLSGDLIVSTGGDLRLSSIGLAGSAYAQIGHGDDLRGVLDAQRGSGLRSGNLSINAGGSFEVSKASVGHAQGSDTDSVWISVAANDPTNPGAGSLLADAGTIFRAGKDLRFYLPRRGNNRIAPGALLNGVLWDGARPDPSPEQGREEFTRHLLGLNPSDPDEHTNVPGSGPAPTQAEGYAFYYDTLVIGKSTDDEGNPPLPPVTPLPQPPIPSNPDGDDDLDLGGIVEDWQKDLLGRHTEGGETELRYEGFEQYGPNGEVRVQVDLDWLTDRGQP